MGELQALRRHRTHDCVRAAAGGHVVEARAGKTKLSAVAEIIRQRLAALEPESLTVEDESAQHAGHEGARGGGGHYRVRIVSRRFAGAPLPARHRMIYAALGALMQKEIHMLAIDARAPDEIDA